MRYDARKNEDGAGEDSFGPQAQDDGSESG